MRKILKITVVTASLYFTAVACTKTSSSIKPESIPTVSLNLAPVVTAGSDQTIMPSATLKLNGTVSDRDSPQKLVTQWTKLSGSGKVTFGDASAVNTTANFSEVGTYVLRLTAEDGELSGKDEVTINVSQTGIVEVTTLGVFEQSFSQSGEYTNPYQQVTATAIFNQPGGDRLSIPLFWDGDKIWKVRFSPELEGTWNWSISSNDPGLDGQSGSFQAVASNNQGGIRLQKKYPYHFEYQDGTPFWFFGDTNWSVFNVDLQENLHRESVKHYIDVRADQGFNYIHANLLSNSENEGGKAFLSFDNETINPAFWQEVDSRLEYINQRGITAMLMLAWGADRHVGNWQSFPDNDARLRYARYIAARYSVYNIAFNVAGEWNEFGDKKMYQAIGKEIAQNDPHNRLIAIHPGGTRSVQEFAEENWISFGDYQQNYTELHSKISTARKYHKPVVNSEYAYYLRDKNEDGKVDKPNSSTLAEIRHATWDIVMAGGYFVTGWGSTYFSGKRDPGLFEVDAPQNDDWEEDVQHIRKFFTELEWWKLEPDNKLITGSGTHYVLAESGQQYVVYVRGGSDNLSLSLGNTEPTNYNVQLFNPRQGTYTAITDYTGTNSIILEPPDKQDWVFLLTNR